MGAKRSSKDIAEAKLAKLKAKHFTPEGRKERIAKALQILEAPTASFSLDRETWKWIAEDADLEDL
ncbi:MAG: hypothetical protein ACREQW_18795 [Candidatus Binatia bacterium]